MTKPIKLVIDCSTGITTEVELSEAEILQMEIDAADTATRKANEEAEKAALEALKSSAKAKLIAGEPLTPEEAEKVVF